MEQPLDALQLICADSVPIWLSDRVRLIELPELPLSTVASSDWATMDDWMSVFWLMPAPEVASLTAPFQPMPLPLT